MSENELEFHRRIDQIVAKPDELIAVDDGVPSSNLDKESLRRAVIDTVCRGIYSYRVLTKDGELTHVALEVTKGPNLREPGF